jgi:hypothetical protein
MKHDEIIFMARASGWMSEYESSTGFSAEAAFKFAALVASAEREACAKVCENVVSNEGYVQSKWCSDAIRARGQAS